MTLSAAAAPFVPGAPAANARRSATPEPQQHPAAELQSPPTTPTIVDANAESHDDVFLPPPQPQPRFRVTDTRRAAARPSDSTRGSPLAPTINTTVEEQQWLRAQRDSVAQTRAARLREFTDTNENAVVTATPICVRIISLLAEARRYERRCVSERHGADSADLQRQRLRHIDAAYSNLIHDVRRRGAVIAAHKPEPAQQHNLGSEAIGCFSSMLPWSEGVVALDVEYAATPPFGAPISGSADDSRCAGSPVAVGSAALPPAARRSLPQGLRPRTAPNTSAHGSPVAVGGDRPTAATTTSSVTKKMPAAVVSYKWTVPQRLAVDNRKLAACTASRRKRLAAITPAVPRSPTPAVCCAPSAPMAC